MGEHKYNPVAQLAKEGKLPLKSKPVTMVQLRRYMEAYIRKVTSIDKLEKAMGITDFYHIK